MYSSTKFAMRQIIAFVVFVCCTAVVSCTGQQQPPPNGLNSSTDCLLDSVAITVMGNTRTGKFTWENGLPATAWMRWPKGLVRDIRYHYDSEHRLIRMEELAGGNSFIYVYTDNQMTSIESESDNSVMLFEYNDAGQIAKQTYESNGAPTRVLEFSYDAEGLPVSSTTVDPVTGEQVSRFDFTYADQPNPLSPFGVTINVFETSYGYPIGRCGKQLTSVTINFLRDAKTIVNNAQPRQGDSEEIVWSCEYNTHGWPQYWKMERGTMVNEAQFMYGCP